MKLLCTLLLFGLASVAFGLTLEEQWAEFKVKFEKKYEPEEDQKRFEIFKGTVAHVEAHNRKFDAGEVSYSQGINHFADLTEEELAKRTGGLLRRTGGLKKKPPPAPTS